MQNGPIVDAEFEVVADPHPTAQELAERDRKLAADLRIVDRVIPELRGWRLWRNILLAIAIGLPLLVGYIWTMTAVVGWFTG